MTTIRATCPRCGGDLYADVVQEFGAVPLDVSIEGQHFDYDAYWDGNGGGSYITNVHCGDCDYVVTNCDHESDPLSDLLQELVAEEAKDA